MALDGPAATIGIVLYHQAVPINDFDFLNYRETLRLDWNDPWYSRIRSPRLKRYYHSPLSTYLYADPKEVRLEVVLRTKTLQEWLDLPNLSSGSDSLATQKKISDFFLNRTQLMIDGQIVHPVLDQLQLLRLSLSKIDTLPKMGSCPPEVAMLGIIFVVPTTEKAREIELKWDLFSSRISSVPVTMNQSEVPKILTRKEPTASWNNLEPELGGVFDVRQFKPLRVQWTVPIPTTIIGFLALSWLTVGLFWRGSFRQRIIPVLILLGLAGLLGSVGRIFINDPFAKPQQLTDEEAGKMGEALLGNVYHSFDFRGEEAIYDTLSRSVAGDLLRQTYLDIRRSLEVQNQTARAKEVKLQSAQVSRSGNQSELKTRCRWTVHAVVSHLGHTHERIRLYDGELTMQWLDDTWKITALTLLDQSEVIPPSPAPVDKGRGR